MNNNILKPVDARIMLLGQSFLFTSFFCLIIAFLTYTLWQGFFYIHLLVSFGFGYSALTAAMLLHFFVPQLNHLKSNAIALVFALLSGTINASFWLNQYEQFPTIYSLKPVIFLGIIFTGICFYFFHSREQQAMSENALEVAKRKQSDQEKALILSQLNQLQSQIEPHFLFNTLANVQALIELDPKKARIMLGKLTELLRATLTTNRSSLTNVEQEITLLSAYLDIQQIRLAERLTYRINNNISLHHDELLHLPPFLLQPLIENAIQHGIEPKNKGGEIIINFNVEQENLIIEIADSGIGLQENSKTKGNGISLSNIQQRLTNLFDGKACLSIKENKQGGVSSLLLIPLEQLTHLKGQHH